MSAVFHVEAFRGGDFASPVGRQYYDNDARQRARQASRAAPAAKGSCLRPRRSFLDDGFSVITNESMMELVGASATGHRSRTVVVAPSPNHHFQCAATMNFGCRRHRPRMPLSLRDHHFARERWRAAHWQDEIRALLVIMMPLYRRRRTSFPSLARSTPSSVTSMSLS